MSRKQYVQSDQFGLPPWQERLVLQISASLERSYVFPEKLVNIRERLIEMFRQHFTGVLYPQTASEKIQFAEVVRHKILTILLGDPHLAFFWDPTVIAVNKSIIESERCFPWALPDEDPRSMPPEIDRRKNLDELVQQNYGLKFRPDSVPAEVGYIGFNFMADIRVHPEVIQKLHQSILNFQNQKAVIIDLRGCSGGSPELVRYFLIYFIRRFK